MYYSLERFEENLAVLCGDDDKTVAVDRTLLPQDAKAGELFYVENGCYCRDADETANRRARIQRLEQMLRNKKQK